MVMKFAEIKLPFGLNEYNTLIHVADVESGKCSLICPSCRSPLTAVKGSKNQHHFRHDVDNECVSGVESAIHLAAKQMIKKEKKISLPKYGLSLSEIDSKGERYTVQKTFIQDGTTIEFDSVQEEIALHEMKADILALKGNKQLIIEICYRHKVDDQKLKKLINANISAIEIDLKDLKQEDLRDMKTFWSFINDPERIKWLYHSRSPEYNRKLAIQLKCKVKVQEAKYKKEKEQFVQALEDVKSLSSNEYIAKLKDEAQMHPVWKHNSRYLQFSWHELPDFLNADVPDGDWIFGCDRRIWQTAFYNCFIRMNDKVFPIKNVDNWLQNKLGLKVPESVKIVAVYRKKYPELVSNDISHLPSSWRTLQAYFKYLCKLGMLEFSPGYRDNYWIILSKNPKAVEGAVSVFDMHAQWLKKRLNQSAEASRSEVVIA